MRQATLRDAGWLLALMLVAAILNGAGSATAIADPLVVEWRTEYLSGPGVNARGIHAEISLGGKGHASTALSIAVDELRIGDADPIADLHLTCTDSRFELPRFQCDDARLSFNHPLLNVQDMVAHIRWDGDAGGEILLADAPLLGREVRIRLKPDAAWVLTAEAPAVDLAAIAGSLSLAGLTLSGKARLDAQLLIAPEAAPRLEAKITVSTLSFADATSTWLGEALAGAVDLQMDMAADGWQGRMASHWQAGEALTPFAYVLAEAEHSLELSTRFSTDMAFSRIELTAIQLEQSPWLKAGGQATLSLNAAQPLKDARIEFPPLRLQEVFERYLVPVLAHPVLSALSLSGRVGGKVRLSGAGLSDFTLTLDDIGVTATTDTADFAVDGLRGKLTSARGAHSELAWKSARLFGFDMGAVRIPLDITAKDLRTREPVSLPVLDGALNVDAFGVDWRDSPPDVSLDAVLLPLSMEKVTKALGWIPMQGSLSGVLPRVSLKRGGLQVGGNLLVQVFDGTLVIRDLKVSDLFGFWPVLTADVQCRDLDLEMLTGTYEFGRITGRLEGHVDGLRLENWRPVAFDARFQTPSEDRSRHRISQRAVDNITSLSGNDLSGVLSRTFLRFFDDFSYSRLGIACRLKNGICEMDGVAPAEQGYYLVKGGGIPRIDVIGFNRTTDWDLLLERLMAVTAGGPPVIE